MDEPAALIHGCVTDEDRQAMEDVHNIFEIVAYCQIQLRQIFCITVYKLILRINQKFLTYLDDLSIMILYTWIV